VLGRKSPPYLIIRQLELVICQQYCFVIFQVPESKIKSVWIGYQHWLPRMLPLYAVVQLAADLSKAKFSSL